MKAAFAVLALCLAAASARVIPPGQGRAEGAGLFGGLIVRCCVRWVSACLLVYLESLADRKLCRKLLCAIRWKRCLLPM